MGLIYLEGLLDLENGVISPRKGVISPRGSRRGNYTKIVERG